MEPITIEQVTELINTTVSGLAARQQKEFVKLVNPLTEQLTAFQTSLDGLKTAAPPVVKEGETAPDPKIALMERELNDLKVGRAADQAKSAKLEREAALGKALGAYSFANDTARDTAFKVFSSDIAITSDGQYVIGDQPLADAVKTRMTELPGLLAAKAVGGSGSSSGSGQTIQSNEIKPGMKPEEYQAIFANIQAQMPK